MFLIVAADAIIDPRAVVVHPNYAAPADPAVVRPRRLYILALKTVLIKNGLDLLLPGSVST